MNSIVSIKGEYLRTNFTGSNGYWELIQSAGEGKATECEDTFINRKTGGYLTAKRKEVYLLAEAKTIY